MPKQFFISSTLILALAACAFAQDANVGTTATQPAPRRPTSSTRKQTTTTTTTTTATAPAPPAPVQPGAMITTRTETTNTTRTRRATTPARAAAVAAERDVRATFDALLRAIEKTDVEAVMNFYWNSPQLLIYNNNGTITRGWTQMHENLTSLYPETKNVKLTARDVKAQMLGTDAALVTCAWTQTQEFRDVPESNSGRMTLLFRRVGGAWQIAHRHTSPNAPDPARLPASEQTAPPPAPKPTPSPARP